MTGAEYAVALLVVTIGATLQGSIGFGINLLVAPMLAIIDPGLLPAVALLVAFPLNVGLVTRDHRAVRLGRLSWALGGRVLGSLVGVSLLVAMSEQQVAVLIGVGILAAVALSVSSLEIEVTPRTMLVAGLASGVGATTAGVGGPPMGILLQRSSGQELRGQLGGFLLVGVVVSLAILAVAGEVSADQVRVAVRLLPGVAAGLLIAGRLHDHVDGQRLRTGVLAVAAASAVVVLVRAMT